MIKNNFKLFFFLSILLLTSFHLSGQNKNTGSIKGRVIDVKDGSPIPYATIKLSQLPMYIDVIKAIAADKDGWFEIAMPPGDYIMISSSVGYKSSPMQRAAIDKAGEIVDLGIIKLEEDEVKLQEIVIKPLVSVSSSEIIYNLDQDPDRETSTLHQIIDKVPMIKRLPNGKIYVGDPESSFLVVRNGKEDALFSNKESIDEVLKSLPAKAFASVTIKLMPESRYGNYKYVLSIESDKTNRLFGVVNMNDVKYNAQNGTTEINPSFLSSYDRLRWNLSGGVTSTRTPSTKQTIEQNFFSDNLFRKQEGKDYTSGEDYSIGTIFSYDLAKQHFITGRIYYYDLYNRNKKDIYNLQEGNNVRSEYRIRSILRSNAQTLNGKLNYQYDFSKPKRVLNVLYDFSYSPGDKNSDVDAEGEYQQQDISPELEGDEKNNQHTVQVHYSDPLSSNLGLEAGMSYIFRDYRTRSIYKDMAGNPVPEQFYNMESRKHIISNYLNLRYTSKKWSAGLKIKSEYVNDGNGTEVELGSSAPEFISETGFSLTPNISASLMLDDKFIRNISFSYSWDKYRPAINMMTTNTNYSNPHYITVGNPELKPEDVHRGSFGFYTKIGLSFNIYGYLSDNKISQYWYQNNDKVIQSYANYGNYKSVGIGANYPLHLKKILLFLQCSGYYEYSKTADEQTSKIFSTIAFINANIPVYKTISLNLQGGYNKRHSKGMQKANIDPFSFSVSSNFKLFKERLEVETGIRNILRMSSKFEQTINMPDFHQYQKNKTNCFPFHIQLKWRIGSFKVKPVKRAYQETIIDDISRETNISK